MRKDLLRDLADVERRVKIEGKGFSSGYRVISEGIKCYLRSAGEKDNFGRLMRVGKDFVVYFDEGEDIKEGDKLRVRGLEIYVNGISRNIMAGSRVNNIKCICSMVKE